MVLIGEFADEPRTDDKICTKSHNFAPQQEEFVLIVVCASLRPVLFPVINPRDKSQVGLKQGTCPSHQRLTRLCVLGNLLVCHR